jgi:hypothetical protein
MPVKLRNFSGKHTYVTTTFFMGLLPPFLHINEYSIIFGKFLPKRCKSVSNRGRSVPIQSFVFFYILHNFSHSVYKLWDNSVSKKKLNPKEKTY